MAARVPFGVSLQFPTKTPVFCANISTSGKMGSQVTGSFLHGPARLLNHDAASKVRTVMCSEYAVPQYLSTLEQVGGFQPLSELTWDYFTGQKKASPQKSFKLWSASACSEDFNRIVRRLSFFH